MNQSVQIVDKKSLVKNILALSDRGVSFRVIQSIMRSNGTKIKSWEEVSAEVQAIKDGDQALIDIQDAVRELLEASYFFWDQAVCFFRVPEKLVGAIKKVFSSEALKGKVSGSPYSTYFPYILSEDQLNDIQAKPGFATYLEFDSFKSILFAQKSFYTDKITRAYDDLGSDNEKSAFHLLFPNGFDQAVAIRRIPFSFYYSISLTDEDTLEVRMEVGTSAQDTQANLYAAIDYFEKFFEKKFGITEVFSEPLNLFPAIKKLYDQTDGKIVDDKFSTGSGMLGNNKMRFASADIRKDSYHAGGEQAVKADLQHFGIVKTWDLHAERKACQPAISLTARPQDINKKDEDKELYVAVISNCGTESDYKHIRRKLFIAAGI